MPINLKKANKIDSPRTLYDSELDKIDFVNDPDVLRDQLPQPYRRIDKILNEILDDVWNVIETREIEKINEASKPRPAKYENLFILENVENVNCITTSTDEDSSYLFIGANNAQIHAVDAASLKIVDRVSIEDSTQNIISITSSLFKQSTYLVSAITDTGNVCMYLFIMNKFHPIQSIIENNDGEKKTSYIKCELSDKSDYIALIIESKVNQNETIYIEVYKTPKELWLQQIEALIDRIHKAKVAEENNENLADHNETNGVDQHRELFTKPSLLCRIRPPVNQSKIQPTNTLNISQILKATENCDLIGLGINHLFSKLHLDVKSELIDSIYNTNIEEKSTILNPSDVIFKFIHPNRFIPISTNEQDIPNSLMVCWGESNQLLFYPFSKIPKDLEARVECCLPFSSEIVDIELTKHSTLIAVALKNNNIVVLDTIAGIDRKCVHLDIGSIKAIQFLPAYHGLENDDFRNVDFHYKVNTQLICLADDGRVFLIDCTVSSKHESTVIYTPKYNNNDDKICLLIPCKNIPSLALVIGLTNKIFLLDIFKNSLVCELENHSDAETIKLNEISFAYRNKILFVKCDDGSSNISKLFAHTLRLIPKLEDYFTMGNDTLYSNNYLPSCSLNERMKILIKQRINEQYYRKERLAVNWSKLHEQKNI